MKKVMLALFLFAGSAVTHEARAQVNISINIGSQPAWGPTGYDHADYYYLPEINCYYDIGKSQFIYPNGNSWTYARTLPSRYRNINLYNTYKVVVNQPNPYKNNRNDMRNYAQYRSTHNQPVIRDSKDHKYFASKGHPQHKQWEQEQHNSPDHGPRDNRGRR